MGIGLPEPPFCYCFRTLRARYAYDVNTNHIIQVHDDGLWDLLRRGTGGGEPEATTSRGDAETAAAEALAHAQSVDGVLLPCRLPSEHHEFSPADVMAACARGIPQVVLSLTNHCNMRCSYCVQSELYPGYHDYPGDDMPWTIAREALDLLLRHGTAHPAAPTGRPVLGFYGGEPLLRFDLVRQSVEYLEGEAPGRFSYAITTNGTLLSAPIREFMAAHDVDLLVSVDGPSAVHDGGRRFADGGPSSGAVLSSLRNLKQEFPSYYGERVAWSCVLTSTALGPVADFVRDCDLAPGLVVVTGIRPGAAHADRGARSSWWAAKDWGRTLRRVARDKRLCDMGPSERVRTGAWLFERGLQSIYDRPMTRLGAPRDWLHSGPCMPGQYRVVVAPDGWLYPCAEVPWDARFRIGSAASGLDLDAMAGLLNRFYALTRRECSHCFALRLCSLCPAVLAIPDRWSEEGARRACTAERRRVARTLRLMCSLLEVNPAFLDRSSGEEAGSCGTPPGASQGGEDA